MTDHGFMLTHFENMFGPQIEHEVIKMVLQSCDWNFDKALETFMNIADPNYSVTSNEQHDLDNKADSSSLNKRKVWNGVKNNPQIYEVPKLTQPKKSPEIKKNLHLVGLEGYESVVNRIDQGENILILLRGLPGSGKSTLANRLRKDGIVLSSDDYFYDIHGNYSFNPSNLSEAHQWNKERARNSLAANVTPIIIDNTNLQAWEMEPYAHYALDYNYAIEILEPSTSWRYNPRELFRKGIHNVPKSKIEYMKSKFVKDVSVSSLVAKRKGSSSLNLIQKSYSQLDTDDQLIQQQPYEQSDVDEDSDPDVIIESSTSEDDGKRNECNHSDCQPNIECIIDRKSDNNSTLPNEQLLLNEFSKLNIASSETNNLTKGNDNDTDKVTVDEFNELVQCFQVSLEKNIKQNNSFSIADNTNNCELSVDKEMYEFCESLNLKAGEHALMYETQDNDDEISQSKISEAEAQEEILTWDCLEPDKLAENWESTSDSYKDNNIKDLNQRKCRRRDGNPNKWINENISVISSDDYIDFWNAKESGTVNWDLSDDESTQPSKSNFKDCKPKSDCQTSLNKVHSSTQACLFDLEENLNGYKRMYGLAERFIPNNSMNSFNNSPYTSGKLFLDKGTITDDNVDPHKGGFEKLIAFFPDLPKTDLFDIYEKCNKNVDWSVNLLMDSGYAMKDIIEDLPITETVNSDSQTTSTDEEESCNCDTEEISDYLLATRNHSHSFKQSQSLIKEKKDIEMTFSPSNEVDDRIKRLTGKTYENLNISKLKKRKKLKFSKKKDSFDTEGEEKEGAQYLTLTIDPLFASQLINIFGPIEALSYDSELNTEARNVVLPLELCHQVYKSWSDTLNGKFDQESAVLNRLMRADEELAKQLQKEEDSSNIEIKEDVFAKDPPASFKEIMDLEKALSLSIPKQQDVTYSYLLNLQKLCENFPNMSQSVIQEEYDKNDKNYQKTFINLSQSFGYGKEAVTWKADVEKNDVECYADELLPKDPQMYRSEAEIHYNERKKAFKAAQDASQKGMIGVAAYYAQIGNLHTQKYKEANDRAAQKILENFNCKRDPNTLDLHLLHVQEALRATQLFLSERKNVLQSRQLHQLTVYIITGKGNHNSQGQSVLRPVIEKFLRTSNYSFSKGYNSGMLVVTLTNSHT